MEYMGISVALDPPPPPARPVFLFEAVTSNLLLIRPRSLCRPFAQRYCVLLATGKGAYQPLDMNSLSEGQAAEISRRILQATKSDGWQMGKTRVFLRAGQLALLEVRSIPVWID